MTEGRNVMKKDAYFPYVNVLKEKICEMLPLENKMGKAEWMKLWHALEINQRQKQKINEDIH